jgi:hypothetical protein
MRQLALDLFAAVLPAPSVLQGLAGHPEQLLRADHLPTHL